MYPKDTIIDHVKEVNEKIKKIHSKDHIMSEEAKYKALYNTLPPIFQNILESFWIIENNNNLGSMANDDKDFLHGKTRNYINLVYLLLEDYIWKNLRKSSVLSRNPNLKTSRFPIMRYPWHNKIISNVLNRTNIEYTIPYRVCFKYY